VAVRHSAQTPRLSDANRLITLSALVLRVRRDVLRHLIGDSTLQYRQDGATSITRAWRPGGWLLDDQTNHSRTTVVHLALFSEAPALAVLGQST
jgi:hypothetical protein